MSFFDLRSSEDLSLDSYEKIIQSYSSDLSGLHNSNPKCRVLAYYMTRYLLKKILISNSRFLKSVKFRYLFRWKYSFPIRELGIEELTLRRLAKIALKLNKIDLLKVFMKWLQFSKLSSIYFRYSKKRQKQDELHNKQAKHIKRAITQANLKQSENESNPTKNIFDIAKPPQDQLRVLLRENEDLKDTLEALIKTASSLKQEVALVLSTNKSTYQESKKKLTGLR